MYTCTNDLITNSRLSSRLFVCFSSQILNDAGEEESDEEEDDDDGASAAREPKRRKAA